ncbi:Aste57867_21172 [Aphanomyces stellatus]|uniref:poly(ADP-ribose) glycohydrolase n=1 Tax=Aphanomyces stellatus TaxID=120398 RepID=A0A485LGU5_9STRA|nr:hypothetical protein As57867_021104 [Aphanomyces stellatus]VFT97846.1 Aste57867_21172 [Aphanomyces stellatus]
MSSRGNKSESDFEPSSEEEWQMDQPMQKIMRTHPAAAAQGPKDQLVQRRRPSFKGWTFACLGLTRTDEARVAEIVRLHDGQMEAKQATGGGHLATCSHVVAGYWFPCLTPPPSDDSPVYVSLHWLETVHATKRNVPYDESMLFQPPSYIPTTLALDRLSYPAHFATATNWCTHVQLPCSPHSMFEYSVPRWPYIVALLAQPITTFAELERTIHRITGRDNPLDCLRMALQSLPRFFDSTMPVMIELALDLPTLFSTPVPLLTQQTSASVALSQRQIAALLVHGFLCSFPHATDMFNHINFYEIYYHEQTTKTPSWGDDGSFFDVNVQKLRTLVHYFDRVAHAADADDSNRRHVVYRRVCLDPVPDWRVLASSSASTWTPVDVHGVGAIEAHRGALQVDFANKFAGGGVLGHGCVQEEIRFLINPECLVACLLTEVLGATTTTIHLHILTGNCLVEPNECFLIHGSEQYAVYTGYGSTYAFAGNVDDATPILNGRRDTVIVGIDASKYYRSTAWHQYRVDDIARELTKAHIGFQRLNDETTTARIRPVATGNWGCGVFGGDVELKFLVQWIAASWNGRAVAYYTFGNEALGAQLTAFAAWATSTPGVSVATILTLLLDVASNAALRAYMKKHHARGASVFAWVQQQFLNSDNID